MCLRLQSVPLEQDHHAPARCEATILRFVVRAVVRRLVSTCRTSLEWKVFFSGLGRGEEGEIVTTAKAAASKSTSPRLSVAIRCDASQEIGLGHLVRQLALAEELRARGHRVVMLGGYSDSGLATRLLTRSQLPVVGAEDDQLDQQLLSLKADVVVLDGYGLSPSMGQRLMDAGLVVMAMVDGEYGLPQNAHIFVDQNFGAERPATVPHGAVCLVGSDYVLLRDAVLRMQFKQGLSPSREAPRILTVIGGTDASGLTESVVRLLLRVGIPVEIVAITADLAARESISDLPVSPTQAVSAIPPVEDLASTAMMYDAVVTAAGSTVWELLYLGVPIGLVSVAANQEAAYSRLKASDLVSAIGTLPELLSPVGDNSRVLQYTRAFLDDAGLRESRSRAGMALIDGLGRARVARWIERSARKSTSGGSVESCDCLAAAEPRMSIGDAEFSATDSGTTVPDPNVERS